MRTRFAVGAVTIDRIVEEERAIFDALTFFPTLTPELLAENRDWLAPTGLDAATGKLIFCVQSYVLRTPHHTILVDSCIGDGKSIPGIPEWHRKSGSTYLDALAAAGLGVADIDIVLCTHLHVDHVGWNTRLADGRWVPTFPNARYIFARQELDYWLARHAGTPLDTMAESVIPILEAKRAELVTSDHAIDDTVRLEPTPGHTIGHVALRVASSGEAAVLAGDLIHSPLQARYPEISMRSDYDPAQAAATRRRFLECACDTPSLVCTAHFPSPSCGHVTRWGAGFAFTQP